MALGEHLMRTVFKQKTSALHSEWTQLKPMHLLDGPVGWPVVGNFLTYLRKKNRGRMHEVQAELHIRYGRLFREKWGFNWQVHLSDPDLIEEVYRQEGKFPNRPSIRSWQLYKRSRSLPMGLTTGLGEEWRRARSAVQKQMMCPKSMSQMTEPLNGVAADFVRKLRHLRQKKSEEYLYTTLQTELYKWGMEGVGTLLFETRLGCLDIEPNQKSEAFISAVFQMLESSLPLIIGEKFHHKWNTVLWKRHSEAWDKILQLGAEYIDDRLNTSARRETVGGLTESAPMKGPLLTHLINNTSLDTDEIYSNITELLVGAVDTTANSVGFSLHLLSSHEEAQQKMRDEISQVLGSKDHITNQDLILLKYTKAVVKESLRLYPVATMNCRILSKDIVLSGHRIPKETLFVLNHYAAGRDANIFKDPDSFIPERWLRPGPSDYHPFASLPFGYGPRNCIGQKMAKLQMYILLAKIVQNFDLVADKDQLFRPQLRTLLTPGDCIPVKFTER